MESNCDHIIAVIDDRVIQVSQLSPLELMRLAGAGLTYKYCPDCGIKLIEVLMEKAHATK